MAITFNANTVNVVIFNNSNISEVTFNGNTVFDSTPALAGCIEFVSSSSFTLTTPNNTPTWDYDMEYSFDNSTWATWDGTSLSAYQNGNKYHIYLRGIDNTVISDAGNAIQVNDSNVQVNGDVMNLFDYTDFSNIVFGNNACRNITWITDVTIPVEAETIMGTRVFDGCTGLVNMTVNNSVVNVPNSFCAACTSLETVHLPNTVTSLGQRAFQYCRSLRSLTILSTTPPSIAANTTFSEVPADCAIYVPASAVATYQAASGWSDRAAYIQAIPS